MGMYWTTILYHGRLLSPTARERLAAALKAEEDMERYVTFVGQDRWILAVPERFVQMGNMDPVLEEHEKKTGRVARSEVEKWLAGRDLLDKWNSVSREEVTKVESYAKIAGEDPDTFIETYICEISWTTYEREDDSTVIYNIRVK